MESTIQRTQEQWLQDLKAAIVDDCPNLVSLYDGFHYSIVYDYSSTHIFVMNPSLCSIGSILNEFPKEGLPEFGIDGRFL